MPDPETADIVKQKYEGAWSSARAAIEAEIAAGETDLARLLHRSFPNIGGARKQMLGVSALFGVEVPAPFLTARRIARDWYADNVIAEATRVGADAIVELGSGYGYNLFNVWIRGGPTVPYHAFEYTEAGIAACLRMREAAVSGPDLTTHSFDYYASDLATIAGRYRHPIIYSAHSVEQIRELPRSCIDALLSVAPEATVIHFEPVGWQLEPDTERSRFMRVHSKQHGYNENLWPLLQSYAAEGLIVIEETAPNFMAAKMQNGASLIRWRKA